MQVADRQDLLTYAFNHKLLADSQIENTELPERLKMKIYVDV